ncbi:Ig-like domain-containing protein [Rhodocaloribacter litoris]|uniref:Ig-like domain-containing protein n=1 Tax=Rhodocaloribacter litoris TaxID=2558931 RepID=UPI0014219CF2|nr:Ig-like domain-containing protein [Rhodocaloribacter litoris]QXD14224.1 Ig-like domain-containing protein [Rhodocaloribacter litoris]
MVGKTGLLGLACLLLLLAPAGCATPVPPSGGPPDQTPPAVVAANPPAGAVNVTADRIEITFSEHVDEASFARAFSLTPDFDRPPDLAWHGRRVEIRFPEPLRANTTYVLTIDNSLRDLRGVALRAPITLAFSTGPRINRGQLTGRVLAACRDEGVPGLDVYAYPAPGGVAPAPLPDRPAYRTQTDSEGRFRFEYLSTEPLFVVALADRNRNRRPDPSEPFAVPPAPALIPDTSDAGTGPAVWRLATLDTIPPVPRLIRPRSNRRLAVLFSEPVRLAHAGRVTQPDTAGWIVRDSVAAARRAVRAVYQVPEDPLQVIVLTDPLAPGPHTLYTGAVVDTSGNPARKSPLRFVPSTSPDTVTLRFRGFVPDTADADPDGAVPFPPGHSPAIRFNQPVDSARFHTLVTLEDTAGRPLAFTRTTRDGVTYHLHPAAWPPEGAEVRVDVRPLGADTVFSRRFRPLQPDELGELSGHVTPDTTAPLVVELHEAGGTSACTQTEPAGTTRPDRTGYFIFRELPGDRTYRFRAFLDRNGNGRWDGGRIHPYLPAEPVTWSDVLPPVRPRWETVAGDTLRVR